MSHITLHVTWRVCCSCLTQCRFTAPFVYSCLEFLLFGSLISREKAQQLCLLWSNGQYIAGAYVKAVRYRQYMAGCVGSTSGTLLLQCFHTVPCAAHGPCKCCALPPSVSVFHCVHWITDGVGSAAAVAGGAAGVAEAATALVVFVCSVRSSM